MNGPKSENGGGYDASFNYSTGYAAPSDSYGSSNYGGYRAPSSPAATLRRRNAEHEGMDPLNGAGMSQRKYPASPKTATIKKLDFMFPKVDTEYTVRTERGGVTSLIACGLIAVLALTEVASWFSQNGRTVEHITVDTSLGKKMRVNLDITFPALACEDLHVDIMDVAGDSQLDIEDTMTKKRLNRRGVELGEETVETNLHRSKQELKERLLTEKVPDDYCGPCYGANEMLSECCNSCDELIQAYKNKRWRTDLLSITAEQCIREGRDKVQPKRLRKGEGCNLHGYFMVNRVGGNFHIAMGEGVERDGRHIHTFNPDDTHNFNASHVINHLSFGPEPIGIPNFEVTTLNGAEKFVTKEYGATGLFQYFIKIVPTTYKGAGNRGNDLETNRYFYTERFRPLLKKFFADDDLFVDDQVADDGNNTAVDGEEEARDSEERIRAVHAGHVGGHAHHDHHNVKKNSVLPGVFFIYEIYPFEVEVSTTSVPLTHLLIRLMATVGGVFTIMRWADSFLFTRERRR
jgi:endoplasmic reticulum-Golgi intermediate compartment protein 3